MDWSLNMSCAFPVGVVLISMAGNMCGLRPVSGVTWKGLVGLACGLLLSGGLFWTGVRGVGAGFWYLSGGILVNIT